MNCGEKHWQAKLTESDVRAIRASQATNKEASSQYGVSISHIWNIRQGRIWKKVV